MRFIVCIEYDITEEGDTYPSLGLSVIPEQMGEGVRMVRADALIRTPADMVADVIDASTEEPTDG